MSTIILAFLTDYVAIQMSKWMESLDGKRIAVMKFLTDLITTHTVKKLGYFNHICRLSQLHQSDV